MGANDQRPNFYEGQYLAAADLDAAVAYPRVQQARHQLGAHTWGIAAGLTLRERPAPGAADRVEVLVQPGLAWDGFGRCIVVDRPQRLPESLCQAIAFAAAVDNPPAPGTPVGRLVRLWIGYTEQPAQPPRAGFVPCTNAELNARVVEGFDFFVGDTPDGAAPQAGLRVGTVGTEAEAALTSFDASAPTLWDGSVPHQSFPGDERRPPRWLVPLGVVRWVARDGSLGYYARADLVAADRAEDRTRAARRYIGAVAQNLEAADGAVVVHRRGDDPLHNHGLAHQLAAGQPWATLQRDLLWVEGHARVVGDATLAGGALRWRDADGQTRNTPLYMARTGDDRPGDGGRELRIAIGPALDAQLDNRLVVGPEESPKPPATEPTLAPRLVVTSGAGATKKQAEGRVGVNTASPLAALDVKGDWDGAEDGALRLSGAHPTLRFAGGADEASAQWMVQLGDKGQGQWRVAYQHQPAQWRTTLALGTDGRMGVATDAPAGRLTVQGLLPTQGQLTFFTPTEDIAWDGGDDQRFIVRQNPPGQTGLLGMALGIGTAAPQHTLHVKGTRLRLESDDGQRVVDLRSDGSQVDLQTETSHLYLRSTTPAAQGAPVRHVVINKFDTDGLVGIGRVPQTDKLEVQGHVRLGPLAQLFAMGCNRPMRTVIGRVQADGSFAPGQDFTATHQGLPSSGQYRIDFGTHFADPPVVLVTAIDPANDTLATVAATGTGACGVRLRDASTGATRDGAFSFVAFGAV